MNLEKVQEIIDRKGATYASCFGTPAGQEVLEELVKANRAGDIFNADPIEMARRVGAFEVIQGIQELINRGKMNGNNG